MYYLNRSNCSDKIRSSGWDKHDGGKNIFFDVVNIFCETNYLLFSDKSPSLIFLCIKVLRVAVRKIRILRDDLNILIRHIAKVDTLPIYKSFL